MGLISNFANVASTCAETFTNTESFNNTQRDNVRAVVFVVVYVALVVVLLLLGKWLYNTFVCTHVTIFKPVKDLKNLLGLMFGLALLMG